ncbi:hypothetical protein [Tessaracoccus sp.]
MRTAHKAITILIAAALTLSACGTSSTPPKPPSGTAAVATPVATTTAEPTAKPTPPNTPAKGWVTATKDNPFGIDWAAQTPFTGPATEKFGGANVMAAYREAVNFSLQQGYSDLMAKGYEARPIEFSLVKPYLTPSAQKAWDGYVKAALAKDEEAGSSVYALTMWNATVGQETYKFRPGQLLYTLGVDFSAAKTSVETVNGADYLSITFTVTRKIRVMDGNKPMLLPVKKDIAFTMTPHGLKDIPWLIDSWNITYTTGRPEVDRLGAIS